MPIIIKILLTCLMFSFNSYATLLTKKESLNKQIQHKKKKQIVGKKSNNIDKIIENNFKEKEEQITKAITRKINDICSASSKKGSTVEIKKQSNKNIKKLSIKLDDTMESFMTFSKKDWHGIQQVLPKDQLKDNKSYRKCVQTISPMFFAQMDNIIANRSFSKRLKKAFFDSIYLGMGINQSNITHTRNTYAPNPSDNPTLEIDKYKYEAINLIIGAQISKYIAAEIRLLENANKPKKVITEYQNPPYKSTIITYADKIIIANININPFAMLQKTSYIRFIEPYFLIGFASMQMKSYATATLNAELLTNGQFKYSFDVINYGIGIKLKTYVNTSINIEYIHTNTMNKDTVGFKADYYNIGINLVAKFNIK